MLYFPPLTTLLRKHYIHLHQTQKVFPFKLKPVDFKRIILFSDLQV